MIIFYVSKNKNNYTKRTLYKNIKLYLLSNQFRLITILTNHSPIMIKKACIDLE